MSPATLPIPTENLSAASVEAQVIGLLLHYPSAGKAIGLPLLTMEDFTLRPFRLIFHAIQAIDQSGAAFDLFAVRTILEQTRQLEGAGGLTSLNRLHDFAAEVVNLERYCRILNQYRTRRQLLDHAQAILKSLEQDDDVFDTLATGRKRFDSIEQGFTTTTVRTLKQASVKALNHLFDRRDNPQVARVEFGIPSLDRVAGSLEAGDVVVFAARPGVGKCHGAETPILLFDGTVKRADEVQVGDRLMGDDSTPRTVLALGRGREMMYWVRQNHGMNYRVNAGHILSLKRSRNEWRHTRGTVLNLSVEEWLASSKKFRSNYKGYKVAVDYPAQELPLDPYFFGLWLGDGRTNAPPITTADPEIVEWLQNYADKNGWRLAEHAYNNRCTSWSVCGKEKGVRAPRKILRDMNVLNNKHIPQQYLSSSREQRLALLAGLVDSDGHRNPSGTFEITTKLPALADGIKALCDSLGLRTSRTTKIASLASRNYFCEVYRVLFNGDLADMPTVLTRKKGSAWTSPIDYQVTGIEVVPDVIDDYFGFVLDGNHLYCLADGTVTHNTDFLVNFAYHNGLKNGLAGVIFSLEMADIQVAFRFLAQPSGVPASTARATPTNDDLHALATAVDAMENGERIILNDTPSHTLPSLRAAIVQAKATLAKDGHTLRWVALDYVQLLKGVGKATTEQAITEASIGIKALAKELKVVVVELAQLGREVDKREPPVPIKADLRASAQIEMDADLIVLPYRPSFYGLTLDSENNPIPTYEQEEFVELIVAKNRNQRPGVAIARYLPAESRFDVFPSSQYQSLPTTNFYESPNSSATTPF